MAYITQAQKKELAPGIKKVLKKYGIKGTISIRNLSNLVITIKEGRLDLIEAANRNRRAYAERTGREYFEDLSGCFQANAYSAKDDYQERDQEIASFYNDLTDAMKGTLWFDKSDSMTDYFHTAYYLDIIVGRSREKPYLVTA